MRKGTMMPPSSPHRSTSTSISTKAARNSRPALHIRAQGRPLRARVKIKYATTRVLERRASKAREGRILCCIGPTSNAAGVAAIVPDNFRHSRHPWRSDDTAPECVVYCDQGPKPCYAKQDGPVLPEAGLHCPMPRFAGSPRVVSIPEKSMH